MPEDQTKYDADDTQGDAIEYASGGTVPSQPTKPTRGYIREQLRKTALKNATREKVDQEVTAAIMAHASLKADSEELKQKLAEAIGHIEALENMIERSEHAHKQALAEERAETDKQRRVAEYWRNEHAKLVTGIQNSANVLLTTVRDATNAGIDEAKDAS